MVPLLGRIARMQCVDVVCVYTSLRKKTSKVIEIPFCVQNDSSGLKEPFIEWGLVFPTKRGTLMGLFIGVKSGEVQKSVRLSLKGVCNNKGGWATAMRLVAKLLRALAAFQNCVIAHLFLRPHRHLITDLTGRHFSRHMHLLAAAGARWASN